MATLSFFDRVFGKNEETNEIVYIPETDIEILSKIGEGGFGCVKKGLYQGNTVAIKTLLLDKQDGRHSKEQGVEDFMKEARLMNELKHPNIVTFIGCIYKQYSMVMEYMSIGPLDAYIRYNQDMSWLNRFYCAIDISKGMAFLHSKVHPDGRKKSDVFHQDLKSANILLCDKEGRLMAKISDFGLSVLRERTNPFNPQVTQNYTSANGLQSHVQFQGGTVDYMAPELQDGTARRFSKACDVYSYGVILFELATLDQSVQFREKRRGLHEVKDLKFPSFHKLMWICTSSDPSIRPPFKNITLTLEKMMSNEFTHLSRSVDSLITTNQFQHTALERPPTTSRSFEDSKQRDTMSNANIRIVKKRRPCCKMTWSTGPWRRVYVLLSVLSTIIITVGLVVGFNMKTSPAPSSTPQTTPRSFKWYAYENMTLMQRPSFLPQQSFSYTQLLSYPSPCTAAVEAYGFLYFGFADGSLVRMSLAQTYAQRFTVSPSSSVVAMAFDYDAGWVCVGWKKGLVRIKHVVLLDVYEFDSGWNITQLECKYPHIYISTSSQFYMVDMIHLNRQNYSIITTSMAKGLNRVHLGTQGSVRIGNIWMNILSDDALSVVNSTLYKLDVYGNSIYLISDTVMKYAFPGYTFISNKPLSTQIPIIDVAVRHLFIFILTPTSLVQVYEQDPSQIAFNYELSPTLEPTRMVLSDGCTWIGDKKGIYVFPLKLNLTLTRRHETPWIPLSGITSLSEHMGIVVAGIDKGQAYLLNMTEAPSAWFMASMEGRVLSWLSVNAMVGWSTLATQDGYRMERDLFDTEMKTVNRDQVSSIKTDI